MEQKDIEMLEAYLGLEESHTGTVAAYRYAAASSTNTIGTRVTYGKPKRLRKKKFKSKDYSLHEPKLCGAIQPLVPSNDDTGNTTCLHMSGMQTPDFIDSTGARMVIGGYYHSETDGYNYCLILKSASDVLRLAYCDGALKPLGYSSVSQEYIDSLKLFPITDKTI